ncbi:MAG: SUMF1/EgtB/PvdO family nonheme iron enzyme [Polyangiaceae bacterium]|jgi:formylglycine-generating enzyme required for sulfatase activity
MDRGLAAALTLGLASSACNDFEVILGCNGTGSDPFIADANDADAAPPSCQAGPQCGECVSESCCTSLTVPGGTFYRTFTNDGGGPTDEADPATVSTFRLDKYLVTVGRFRQFVAAWDGGAGWVPEAGAGKHTHLNGGNGLAATGGGYEPGWVPADDSNVTANITPTDGGLGLACGVNDYEFLPQLAPNSVYDTWTPDPGTQETLPITCANWYSAYAFCIWDGGFLPSEAEWKFAAVGGSEELEYPWGSSDPGTDSQYAIYGCYYPNGSGSCSGVGNIAPVGTALLGAGRWGHLDVAGSLFEWNLDGYAAAYVSPCVDCAYLTTATLRVNQGGNFDAPAVYFPPKRHEDNPADSNAYAYGIRCARTP